MGKRWFFLPLISFLIFSSGCIPLLIGTGFVSGIIFGKDSISGNLDASAAEVMAAVKEVISQRGEIMDEDEAAKTLRAKINDDWINVKVKELTPNASHLRISARKEFAISDQQLAQDIFTEVVAKLSRN